MDKKDKKLLAELDKNPKISLSRLAKQLRISQQVADYRMKKLLKNKHILKFGTIINLKSLRQEHYHVFFTFHSKKNYPQKDIFQYLQKKKGIYWATRVGGKYDLVLILFVKNFEEFDEFIGNFNKRFPGLIKDYKSCYVIDHSLYKHKYLHGENDAINYGYNDPILYVDKLDIHILHKIKDNCRLSALELSKGTDVSYKTIINRIKLLESKKIILGYRLFMKSREHNPFIVLLSYKNYSRQEEKKLLAYLSQQKNITQSVRLFGMWNMFLQVRIEDNEAMQNLIIDLRDKFDIIDDYEIIPVFEDIAIDLCPI